MLKKHKTITKILIVLLAFFIVLFVGGNLTKGKTTSYSDCQGFYLFGCNTSYPEYDTSTGYGFPFNDHFIHSSQTISGRTTTTYKIIDGKNVAQNFVIDALLSVVFTLIVFVIYTIYRVISIPFRKKPPVAARE